MSAEREYRGGIIYLAVNRVNGKPYVGQTANSLSARMRSHLCSQEPFGRSLRKYGIQRFTFAVLCQCSSTEDLNVREMEWIARIGSKYPVGYNLTDGGSGTRGLPKTPEFKALMSKLMSGDNNYWHQHKEERIGDNNPNFGNHKPWSEKRRKASEAQRRDHYKDPEYRARVSASVKAAHAIRPEWKPKGVPATEEQKAKISESKRKQWQDPAYRSLMLVRLRESHQDPEYKARASSKTKTYWAEKRKSGAV